MKFKNCRQTSKMHKVLPMNNNIKGCTSIKETNQNRKFRPILQMFQEQSLWTNYVRILIPFVMRLQIRGLHICMCVCVRVPVCVCESVPACAWVWAFQSSCMRLTFVCVYVPVCVYVCVCACVRAGCACVCAFQRIWVRVLDVTAARETLACACIIYV